MVSCTIKEIVLGIRFNALLRILFSINGSQFIFFVSQVLTFLIDSRLVELRFCHDNRYGTCVQ